MTSKYQSGFTLLELLLFVVMAGITTALLATFLLRITRFSTANSIANSVDQGAVQMLSNIEFFLQDTQEILSPGLGEESQQLSVRTTNNEFIEIESVAGNLIFTNMTTEDSFQLNPDDTTIDSITFQPIPGGQDLETSIPMTLSFSLTLSYISSNVSTDSFEYDYSKTYTRSITLNQNLHQLKVNDGLELWLRSDKDVEFDSSNNLLSWTDQIQNISFTPPSGTPPVVQSEGPGQLPTIEFNGTNSRIRATDITGLPQEDSARTIFVVSKINQFTSSANNTILSYGTQPSSFEIAVKIEDNTFSGLRYDIDTLESIITASFQPMIFTAWYNSNKLSLFSNNQAIVSETNTTLSTNGNTMTIGSNSNLAGHFEGDISEILLYSRALTGSERSAVYDYLNQRYQIQGSIQH